MLHNFLKNNKLNKIKTKSKKKDISKKNTQTNLRGICCWNKLIKTIDFNKITIQIRRKEKNYKINKKVNLERKAIINKKNTEKYIRLKTKKFKLGEIMFANSKNEINSQIIEVRNNSILVKKTNAYSTKKAIDSNINVKENSLIKKGSVICQISYEKQKTEDIVQGLPKIEELLETKKKPNSEFIKKTPNIILKKIFEKLKVKRNNKIAARKSIKIIQKLLVQKIQSVYQTQGVNIADKHMEIIVKQMTSKVIIKKPGNSNLLTGELIEINRIENINKIIKNKAIYEPILLGISKISLSNQSFISEASFQETTRILTRSAIEGKIDWLYGLKENIILGNLMPAGTGYIKLE